MRMAARKERTVRLSKARPKKPLMSPMANQRLFFIVMIAGLFPLRENFGLQFAAADEFLQIANDGAAGDAKFAGERGNVRARFGISDAAANFDLATEAIGGAAEKKFGVDAFAAFEG